MHGRLRHRRLDSPGFDQPGRPDLPDPARVTKPRSALRQAGQLDPARLRHALGRFVSGVIVVTTADGENDQQVHGMTANAFTSVSLQPPLVLVCIANAANLQSRLLASGRYGISVLTDEQESLAQHFAGRQAYPELVRFVFTTA